jgi:dTDP-4-amino-4,6-dideoxygalactose transaminase
VPLAIRRAGLNIAVCDINKDSFDFNINELEAICLGGDILAIVPTHLGGIPLKFEMIEEVAKKYKIFTIEDCAQSLGATYKGKRVGALGDFSFFSLCRGKGLTIYEGGVITTKRNDYAAMLDGKIRELVKEDFFSETLKVLELFGYWAFYKPHLFWFISRLPKIFWNLQGEKLKALGENYGTDFSIHRVSRFRKTIGHFCFSRLEKEIDAQRTKAKHLIDELESINTVKAIKESGGSRATYPYLTLIFNEPEMRKKALRRLENTGLGVSQIYAFCITDYDYLKNIVPKTDCPAGHYLAQRQITLSTSNFLKEKDLNSVLDMIKSL